MRGLANRFRGPRALYFLTRFPYNGAPHPVSECNRHYEDCCFALNWERRNEKREIRYKLEDTVKKYIFYYRDDTLEAPVLGDGGGI